MSELKTSKNPLNLVTGDFNGDGIVDIATINDLQVNIYLQARDSITFRSSTFFVNPHLLGGAAANLNRDKITDFILIHDNPLSIQSYLGKPNGKYYLSWEHNIEFPYENMLIADINNDKKADIIFFGKKKLGATVFLGNGNGTFQPSITLFTEYSFSALAIANLHHNSVKDVIAVNWISNEVLVFSGFGKMKFSDPSSLQYTGEPELLTTAFLDSDNNIDLILGFPDQKKCLTFSGDGVGGFQPMQTITLDFPPSEIASTDINGDGIDDLLILSKTTSNLTVMLNNGKGILEDQTSFYAGKSPTEFRLFTHSMMNRYDVAILDSTARNVRIYYNSAISSNYSNERTYALGKKPAEVLTVDLNHDGWEDLITANTLSNNISMFMNEGNGRIGGQISFSAPFSPSHLKYYSNNDSMGIILLTNPESKNIFVMELNPTTFAHRTYSLPTQGTPDILHVDKDKIKNNLRIITLEVEEQPPMTSILTFEKISGNRFTEQYSNINISGSTFLSAILDQGVDHEMDYLTYIVYNPIQRKEIIYRTRLSSSEQFVNPRIIYSIATDQSIPALLWSAYLNDDNQPDIILNLGEPENKLYIMIGRSDSTFSPPRLINTNPVVISSKDRLRIFDFNNDGINDIVFEDDLKKTIQVSIGHGNGTFSLPMRIASSSKIAGFSIANLNHNSIPELVLTDDMNCVLKIIPLRE